MNVTSGKRTKDTLNQGKLFETHEYIMKISSNCVSTCDSVTMRVYFCTTKEIR